MKSGDEVLAPETTRRGPKQWADRSVEMRVAGCFCSVAAREMLIYSYSKLGSSDIAFEIDLLKKATVMRIQEFRA